MFDNNTNLTYHKLWGQEVYDFLYEQKFSNVLNKKVLQNKEVIQEIKQMLLPEKIKQPEHFSCLEKLADKLLHFMKDVEKPTVADLLAMRTIIIFVLMQLQKKVLTGHYIERSINFF